MNDRSSVSHDHSSKSAERLLLESQQNCPLNVREGSGRVKTILWVASAKD